MESMHSSLFEWQLRMCVIVGSHRYVIGSQAQCDKMSPSLAVLIRMCFLDVFMFILSYVKSVTS